MVKGLSAAPENNPTGICDALPIFLLKSINVPWSSYASTTSNAILLLVLLNLIFLILLTLIYGADTKNFSYILL